MIRGPGEKWRPTVGLVIFTALAAAATLPLVGLFFFRLYDNQLIHQTQAELIAQSRVLAAVYAREAVPASEAELHSAPKFLPRRGPIATTN